MDDLKWQALLLSVDTGSFSGAAEKLGYTPSGITRMVNGLESELGFALVKRGRKGVSLTQEGEQLLPAVRQLAQDNERLRQLSSDIRGLSVGNLTIGTYYSTAACWLPEIIKAFQEEYPGIHIHTIEGGNSDLRQWLADGKVDFCMFSQCDMEG